MMPILQAMAANGSREAKIILEMVKNGVLLMQTEDPSMLEGSPCEINARTLERDKEIAERINAGLEDGGIGILFMGTAHENIRDFLDKDIEVRDLLTVEDTFELRDRLEKSGLLTSINTV